MNETEKKKLILKMLI